MYVGVGTLAKVGGVRGSLRSPLPLRELCGRPINAEILLRPHLWAARRNEQRHAFYSMESRPHFCRKLNSSICVRSAFHSERRCCIIAVRASSSDGDIALTKAAPVDSRGLETSSSEEQEQETHGRGKRVKKRVAMFCGYVGSKFRGLQINRNAEGESTFKTETLIKCAGGHYMLNT